MAPVRKTKGGFSVTAYPGDAKTLLAFNLPKPAVRQLAGFTIQCQPGNKPPFYLFNMLQFERPGDHAQDATEPPQSSINAPIHKFRWLHVPGSVHQGTKPFLGKYTYTVTPRYFDAHSSLQPLDTSLSVSVTIDVVPFKKGRLELGFTRGFVQSQAFVNHFGRTAPIRPATPDLLFNTSAVAGTNAAGQQFTFADEYQWLGFTAREKVFEIVQQVLESSSLTLDMFAYDLNEPDLLELLLRLAAQGRLRLILDNASLHHSPTSPTPEDKFETLFNAKKKGAAGIKRGRFGRFSHDKILIVSNKTAAKKVLTGSTNFSVTGVYVNSNHVIVYDDPAVANRYAEVFDAAWSKPLTVKQFLTSTSADQEFTFKGNGTPTTIVSFAPHSEPFATKLMAALVTRIDAEKKSGKKKGSVMFAVMDLGSGDGPVRPSLIALHKDQSIFSYGISDSTKGIMLYSPKHRTGVLVTGKPTSTQLPPPFNQVPGVGKGHQIHHKFVVCGFNRPDAVVFCGSSNLATGGEELNGDNLLEIHDSEVATAFAIEAVALVDHFEFLDRFSHAPKGSSKLPAAKQAAAVQARMFLSTNDKWTTPYFDANDLRSADRELFGT